jgi:hypothetical protein
VARDELNIVQHRWYSFSRNCFLQFWLMLAESHLTRRLFGAMVRRIAALAVPTG